MIQLYKNIKERRTELHLTQTELAEKMGYADKSMIAKIEKGLIDLPQSKILAFAKALGTTPAQLMGWESTSEMEYLEKCADLALNEIIDALPDRIADHTRKYMNLSKYNKVLVDRYTENLIANQKMEEELLINAAHNRTDIKITDKMKKHDDDLMDDDNF